MRVLYVIVALTLGAGSGYACSILLDTFSAIVFVSSFLLRIYYSKYFDYQGWINSKYNVELYLNKFGVPRLKYSDVVVLRKIASSYLWVSSMFILSVTFLGAFIGNEFFKLGSEITLLLPVVGVILGSLFHIDDIKRLWMIWGGSKTSLYVRFLNNGVFLIETEGVKKSHREVYFYEEAYADYTTDDLRRELILIEQDIYDSNKSGFWDKYLTPVMLIVTTSIIGILNALFISDLSTGNHSTEELLKYYFLSVLIVFVVLVQIFGLKYYVIHPPKPNLVLKQKVIKDLLNRKLENDMSTVSIMSS